MEWEMKRDQDADVLRLKGDLTIQHAAALKELLVQQLEGSTRLNLLLCKEIDFDLSTLQLLCSAHRSAISRDRDLAVFLEDRATFDVLVTASGFKRGRPCRLCGNWPCLWTEEGCSHE
jgi:ABC-type transporter Mla MlaB component